MLRTDIVKSTHGQIIEGIQFFKDKRPDFLLHLVPKLKAMNLFDNDILYSQSDQAEELFFVFQGSVLLLIDIMD